MVETLPKLKSLIAEICDVEEQTIVEKGKLVGYGLDSVRVLDLIMALEDEYGLEIDETDPELAEISTVKELADLVARRIDGS